MFNLGGGRRRKESRNPYPRFKAIAYEIQQPPFTDSTTLLRFHRKKKMRGRVASELQVGVPADDVWAVYSSPELPRLVVNLTPGVYQKIDIVEGDGGVGTVLDIVLTPVNPEPRTWKEKFVTIDNEKRMKVVRQIEGGYLDMGFQFYEDIFKIKANGTNSCIIRSSIVFEVADEFEVNAALVSSKASEDMAKAIANYVIQKKINCHKT
ncbi:hypothetical protein HHK36_028476 [Tetracentron sinense]|uniref:Bet v I/Major latex protein domain-containing protein n=1 Tax=Tetracentron sinense TaxID=13715 RepID=A0A834YDH5_TETSI|nr:hypothetical protein HHK36_028476 [Tetracentron sinense]